MSWAAGRFANFGSITRIASGWPFNISTNSFTCGFGFARFCRRSKSPKTALANSQRSSPSRPPRETGLPMFVIPSHSSAERLVINTFVRPPRSRVRNSFNSFASSSDRLPVIAVPSIPRADSKLSHTIRTGFPRQASARKASFSSTLCVANSGFPVRASPMRLRTYSAERTSRKSNHKAPAPKPPVCSSQRRKPRASVVLPTPPNPVTRMPAAGRCMARSNASKAPSRPTNP